MKTIKKLSNKAIKATKQLKGGGGGRVLEGDDKIFVSVRG